MPTKTGKHHYAPIACLACLACSASCLEVSLFSDADTGASYVVVMPENVPADGTPATAHVVLRRATGAPLQNIAVRLQIDHGNIAQTPGLTNAEGVTQGGLSSNTIGLHTVSAALSIEDGVLALNANAVLNAYTPATAGGNTITPGTSLNLAALQPGADGLADATFRGSVHLQSSDPAATLPADYTYTAADVGVHVFTNITLQTAGLQTITATNTQTHAVLRTLQFNVAAGAAIPATQLALSTANNSVAGVGNSALVIALDAAGDVTAAFLGTVHFSSTDANAPLPVDYTFTPSDGGKHTFYDVAFVTAGEQTLTVSSTGLQSGNQNVLVAPSLPRYLQFATQPNAVQACTPFSPAVQVQEYDSYGNKAVTFGDDVTLTLNSNTLGAVLQGTSSVRTVQGLATFENLAVSALGNGYSLSATIGYEPTPSASFNVSAAAPNVLSVGPITTYSGNIPVPYVISDACGLPVQVTVSLDPNQSGIFTPITAAPSDSNYLGLTNVPTSLTGSNATFLWNSLYDTGHANLPAARLQVKAVAAGVSSAATISAPFALNNGPSLGAAQTLSTGNAEACVALADINNDARLDMLTCNSTSGGASIFLGNGAGAMTPAPDVGSLAAPRGIATGHIDGNSGVDFVLAGGNQVAIYLGTGNGAFAANGNLTMPSAIAAVLLVDINHDGALDVVTANIGGNLSVALGTGTGTFAAVSSASAGTSLSGLAAADMNHDGKLDIVASDTGGNAVVVAVGNGMGGFSATHPYLTGSGSAPSGVALADMNHDGSIDAVVALNGNNSVAVWLGSLTGALSGGVTYGVAGGPTAVGLTDFDIDGNIDAAVSSSNGVSLLSGSVGGALAAAVPFAAGSGTAALAIGDINRDGEPDVVTANMSGLSVSLLANGLNVPHNAHWSCPTVFKFQIAGNYATASVGVGDLNGDSKPDVAVTLPDLPGIGIMLSDGASHLSQGYVINIETPNPQALAVVDVNNDGYSDIVTSSDASNALVVSLGPVTYYPNETAAFSFTNLVGVQSNPQNIATGDLNRDGFVDLLVPNLNSASLSVLINNGAGNFLPQIVVPTGAGPVLAKLADFNGDGNLDAIVVQSTANNLGLYLGNGAGDFNSPIPVPTDAGPHDLSVGDLNGDGFPDVAVAVAANTIDVFVNDGHGTLVAQTPLTLAGTAAVAVALLDVEHNHKDAIVAVNNAEPWQVEVFSNNGSGGFNAPVYTITDYSPGTIALGDLNSDGYDDILTSSTANTVVAAFSDGHGWLQLNTPTGYTAEFNYNNRTGRVTVADFNWDGYLDVAEFSPEQVAIKLGDPAGLFSTPTQLYTVANDTGTHSISSIDMNHDGWPDVVTVLNSGINVTLNNGSGGFGANTVYGPTGLTFGVPLDFNNDGNIDFLVGGANKMNLFLGDGTGALTASSTFSTGTTPVALAAGDINLDGTVDILASVNGAMIPYLRQGATYVAQASMTSGCMFSSNALVDFNRDGKLDAIGNCSTGAGQLSIFFGNGDGTFTLSSNNLVPGGVPTQLSIADVNLDGIPDPVLAISGSKGFGLWVTDPNGMLGTVQYLGDDVHAGESVVADFNWDGLPDILSYGADFGVSLGRW